jgi:hypothetical protein
VPVVLRVENAGEDADSITEEFELPDSQYEDLARMIDHSLLNPALTVDDLERALAAPWNCCLRRANGNQRPMAPTALK